MDVHAVYKRVGHRFRARRMERFLASFPGAASQSIVDVGGAPEFWDDRFLAVTLVNLGPSPDDLGAAVSYVKADGTALPFDDGEFGVAFSNSVIEHVGSQEAQEAFASEIRRVGRAVWVQTPSRWFPIEPHYLTPAIHWLPRAVQRALLRNYTVWGWITRPSPEYVRRVTEEIRLLTRKEMQALFPDCEIHSERFLGLPKSYIAMREAMPPTPKPTPPR